MTPDPRDWPGAARDRTMAVAEMAELEAVIQDGPHSAFCLSAPLRYAMERICNCWRGRALRIIRYGVR